MIRTQIQLTEEQAQALKTLAAQEKKSIADLIRLSVDALLASRGYIDPAEQRERALAAAGKLYDTAQDLASNHDRYLVEALEK